MQRRILWALHEKDDGRFIKVANVVGHTMQYHPHGDASIGDALVVLANKRYLIEGQGNFGNIFTGDPAAAPRYIECRLTELARTELFNDEITEFVPSYDGRNKEPVTLPCKLPLLLMLGTEGIAVGMSSRILPHNFPELLEAQIAILKKQPFKCLPDFQTGGLMDARDYKDGTGEIKVRAKIKVKDESTVVIKEIPPTTTTDSLIASIEDASRKGKIKVKSINDFTSEEVEIEVKAPERRQRGAVGGCALRLHRLRSHHRQPHRRHQEQPAGRDDRVRGAAREHGATGGDAEARTGAQGSQAPGRTAFPHAGAHLHRGAHLQEDRAVQDQRSRPGRGVRRLQAVPQAAGSRADRRRTSSACCTVRIRRISLFDINKHREEMEKVKADLAETRKNLKNLTKYVIGHLEALLAKYGPLYPRLTKSSRYDEVDAKEVAFKAFKVAYDRETGYVGYKVSGEEFNVECTKFDKLILVFKDGHYQVIELPEKFFVGPDLVYCGLPERERVFTLRLHEPRGDLPEALHVRRHDPEQGLSLHPAQIADPVLRAGHAGGALHPLQAGAVSEDQPADLQSGRGGSQRAEDARPADLDQGRLVHQQPAVPRLGPRGGHDPVAVCREASCAIEYPRPGVRLFSAVGNRACPPAGRLWFNLYVTN